MANLDTDKLGAVAPASQDFVIASHVLKHVADALGLLVDAHRVLRPGGVMLILLPDRRRTFDKDRASTPLAHLAAEHAAGVTEADDAHVEDFLGGTGTDVDAIPAERRPAVFDLHRRRSIHVHVWQEQEWPEVVAHGIRELGQRWELVEVLNNGDVTGSIEVGTVLGRSTTDLSADELSLRFEELVAQLGPGPERSTAGIVAAAVRAVSSALDAGTLPAASEPAPGADPASPLEDQLQTLNLALEQARHDAENWRSLALHRGEKLQALAASPVGPVLRATWSVRSRARGLRVR